MRPSTVAEDRLRDRPNLKGTVAPKKTAVTKFSTIPEATGKLSHVKSLSLEGTSPFNM
jgi:hypothetical protein